MRHGVRGVAALLVLGVGTLLAGCGHEPAPTPPPSTVAAAVHPTYDPGLPPAESVMALVPEDVVTLTVTDDDQLRNDLGLPEVGDGSTAADQASFWQQAEQGRPLLDQPLLRSHDAQLGASYGFTSLDVAWEAHFLDAQGQVTGWVLGLRSGVDPQAVQRAVQDGAAPLQGATVDTTHGLVTSGAATDPDQSWAADPDLTALVREPATSTYVTRGCRAGSTGAGDLEKLSAYAVQFGDQLMTAWLGTGRTDLFDRLALGQADQGFTSLVTGGAADPATGRLGWAMTDPAAAARLALGDRLPFTVCG